MSNIFLSLCIPTNGISRWVLPVLESIYNQSALLDEFEVILVDNGNGDDLNIEKLRKYDKFANFKYFKSTEKGFLNQIYAFKKCRGKLIKFVNHRFLLAQGSINYLIEFSKKWSDRKPLVYFSNKSNQNFESNDSDRFFMELGLTSSWSGGVALRNDNLWEKCTINETFPHFFLFNIKYGHYIIDNHRIFEKEIDTSAAKKGKYNLFLAFAVTYPRLNVELLEKHIITFETFKKIKKETFKFIVKLYLDYVLLKKECSYSLENYKNYLNVFYSSNKVKFSSFILLVYYFLRGRL